MIKMNGPMEVSEMKEDTLKIDGMHCGHCSSIVRKSLEMVEGVESAEVEIGSARVRYDGEKATREDLEEAVKRFGYKVLDH